MKQEFETDVAVNGTFEAAGYLGLAHEIGESKITPVSQLALSKLNDSINAVLEEVNENKEDILKNADDIQASNTAIMENAQEITAAKQVNIEQDTRLNAIEGDLLWQGNISTTEEETSVEIQLSESTDAYRWFDIIVDGIKLRVVNQLLVGAGIPYFHALGGLSPILIFAQISTVLNDNTSLIFTPSKVNFTTGETEFQVATITEIRGIK